MVATNKKVVYAFHFFEKRLVLYFMGNIKKIDSKCSIINHKTSRSSLSFQLADLLTLFILFHALILVAHWECKLPPLNGTGKDWELTTDFEKILAFSLARGFE